MATELTRLPQVGSEQTRTDEILGSEAINPCWQKVKKCWSCFYGPPHPPLSRKQICTQYLISTAGVVGCSLSIVVFIRAITQAATNPNPASLISPGESIAISSYCEALSWIGYVKACTLFHKAYKAPRIGEERRLL